MSSPLPFSDTPWGSTDRPSIAMPSPAGILNGQAAGLSLPAAAGRAFADAHWWTLRGSPYLRHIHENRFADYWSGYQSFFHRGGKRQAAADRQTFESEFRSHLALREEMANENKIFCWFIVKPARISIDTIMSHISESRLSDIEKTPQICPDSKTLDTDMGPPDGPHRFTADLAECFGSAGSVKTMRTNPTWASGTTAGHVRHKLENDICSALRTGEGKWEAVRDRIFPESGRGEAPAVEVPFRLQIQFLPTNITMDANHDIGHSVTRWAKMCRMEENLARGEYPCVRRKGHHWHPFFGQESENTCHRLCLLCGRVLCSISVRTGENLLYTTPVSFTYVDSKCTCVADGNITDWENLKRSPLLSRCPASFHHYIENGHVKMQFCPPLMR